MRQDDVMGIYSSKKRGSSPVSFSHCEQSLGAKRSCLSSLLWTWFRWYFDREMTSRPKAFGWDPRSSSNQWLFNLTGISSERLNTQPVHGGLNVLIPCRYYSTATSTFSKRFLSGLLFRAWKVCRRKQQGKNKLDRLVHCFWHSSWEFTPGNGPGGLWPTATYIRCHDMSVSLGLWIIQRAWFLITQSLSPRPEK